MEFQWVEEFVVDATIDHINRGGARCGAHIHAAP
jgi:hypothetical protein